MLAALQLSSKCGQPCIFAYAKYDHLPGPLLKLANGKPQISKRKMQAL